MSEGYAKIKDRVESKVKILIGSGLLRVLSADTINKAIGLVLSVVVVGLLSKYEYGLFGYAFNLVSIFLIASGFGIKNGILQYCSEDRSDSEKNVLYKYGFIYGLLVNIVVAAIIVVYALVVPLKMPESQPYLLALAFVPVFSIIGEYGQIYLRCENRMKAYALSCNVTSFFQAASVIGLVIVLGVYGYVTGIYFGYISLIICCAIVCRKSIPSISIVRMPYRDIWEILKPVVRFSFICMLTNCLSSLLSYLDVLLIGVIVSDSEILASYKVATIIPNAAKYITGAIVLVLYPYFARHRQDRSWLTTNLKRMLGGLAVINLVISVILFFGADLIFSLLYGAEYADAIPMFRLLSIGFLIATVARIPLGNVLLSLRKEKINLVIAGICGVINIVMDIILIPKLGGMGAAITSVSVTAVSGILAAMGVWLSIRKIPQSVDISKEV